MDDMYQRPEARDDRSVSGGNTGAEHSAAPANHPDMERLRTLNSLVYKHWDTLRNWSARADRSPTGFFVSREDALSARTEFSNTLGIPLEKIHRFELRIGPGLSYELRIQYRTNGELKNQVIIARDEDKTLRLNYPLGTQW